MSRKKAKVDTTGKGKGGGGVEEGPSTSSSLTLTKMEMENEELERATIKKYRRIMKDTNTSAMIVYRMNAWKEAGGGGGGPDDVILLGRNDFSVDLHSQNIAYVLSNSVFPLRYRGDGIETTQCIICEHKSVSYCHCEIKGPTYPDDKIWIKGISEYGTFVNGNRIPKGEQYPLFDGDIIGLGAPHHSITDHWGEDKKKRGFVFKVRNLIRWEQEQQNQEVNVEIEDIPSPEFLACNNTVILSQILNSLSFSDLKSVRSVNQFWKGEADRKKFSRSLVKFESTLPLQHSRIIIPKHRKPDYFLFTSSMVENNIFPKWEIKLGDCNKDENKEFYEKILHILKERGHLIRDVKLEISDDDGQRFISILRNLPNLETLRIYLRTDKPILLNDTTFPYVKHFWFDVEDQYKHLMKDVIVQAAKLLPNIEKITRKGSLEPILLPISEHNLWSTGLKEIAGCIPYYAIHVYDTLRALSHNLRKLELHTIPRFNLSEIVSFENMLETHAATLEHLVLRFDFNWYRRSGEKGETRPVLRFPTFPKLKTLEFILEKQEDVKFQITFPSSCSGSVCYDKDFPFIKELRLMAVCSCPRDAFSHGGSCRCRHFDWGFSKGGILDVFIPKDSDTVSRTMTWVEFRLEGEIRTNGNPWYVGFVDRFRRMFPHVHHPQLNETTEMEEDPRNENEEPPQTRMRTRSRLP